MQRINQEIYDSLKQMDTAFVKKAIRKGKNTARDSDEYYNFVMHDIVLYYYTSQPDSMLASLNKSLDYLSRQTETQMRNKTKIKCLQSKGIYYTTYRPDLDSQLYYHTKSCELAEKYPVAEERLLCYNNLADAYRQAGKLAQSAAVYRKAIYTADSAHTLQENYVPLYEGLAATYTALNDFEQSKFWWDKSYALWEYMMTQERFNYLNNRGNDYYYRKDYRNALSIFMKLDTFLQLHPELTWEKYFCRANLSDVYLKLDQPENARTLIEENIAFFQETRNEAIMSYLRTQQMDMALQQGDLKKAGRLIAQYPLPPELKPEEVLLRLDFLQKFHETRSDWKEAYRYYKAYRKLDDSLRNERVRTKALELQMRYERDTTLLNQRIYIGKKENQLMRTYIWLAGFIFLALLLMILIYSRRKQAKIKEEQMLHRIVKLRMENIRNRITPHFIYNALNHEWLMRRQGKPTQLKTLVDLLQQGSTRAAFFCSTLKEELDFIHLYVAVEGEALGKNFEYEVLLNHDIHPENVKLPSMMIQIFVENAIKHGLKNLPESEKKKLTIQITEENGSTCIEIRNNGPFSSIQYTDEKTRSGLRIVSQTIQLLNEKNKQPMSYSLTPYRDNDETGCCARLIIPDHYLFNLN